LATDERDLESGPAPAGPADLAAARARRKPAREFVYTCDCGGQNFFLLDVGMVQCSNCQTTHLRIAWGEPGALKR
jgi:hypothetical protein